MLLVSAVLGSDHFQTVLNHAIKTGKAKSKAQKVMMSIELRKGFYC